MFCSKCGMQLPDNSRFCSKCGVEICTAEVNQTRQNPYQQHQYYVPVYTKPHKPGKGFGIASMILGIFAAIYASMLSLIVLQTILYSFAYDSGSIDIFKNMKIAIENFFESGDMENVAAVAVTCLVCVVLSFVFSKVSRNKGYLNKISMSGFMLSIVSFGLVISFAAFAGYGYINSPPKVINTGIIQSGQNNEDKLVGTWVATGDVATVTFEEGGMVMVFTKKK